MKVTVEELVLVEVWGEWAANGPRSELAVVASDEISLMCERSIRLRTYSFSVPFMAVEMWPFHLYSRLGQCC